MRALIWSVSMLSVLVASPAFAENHGKPIFETRLRYEFVDQAGFAEDANALTLRARLGYETPAYHGFKALIEGEGVVAIDEDYNSTTNGKGAFPIVADPEIAEINRAQISWTGDRGAVIVGRQRLILDNARFIGNSGFRQNEQTFDAVRGDWKPMKSVTLTYAYVAKVRRVFGDDSPQGEWRGDSHILEATGATAWGQWSVYGHALDFDNAPTQSLAEAGARFSGAHKLSGDFSATYEVEYARQWDYGANPLSFDVDYVDVAAGLKTKRGGFSLGVERLDGDGARGFQTPLATLHAFQGWADVFLTTPADGIRDVQLTANATTPGPHPIKMQAALHDFTDADGSTPYGKEFDLSASTPLTKKLNIELAGATFSGETPAFGDRTKVWLTLDYRY